MLSHISRAVLFRIEAWFNIAFGDNNPLYHLGGLGIYFFYIMVVSGIYLFIYYEPTVAGSYNTLQYLTREQWYLGGIMRSLHRYAADGMVLVMVLHILREWVVGRYHGVRWFSWITGIPLLIMVYLTGIEGFWLIWDKLAQFLMVRTAEWLDWFPIFTFPTARNFLTSTDMTDMFFRMLIVIHIALPLFLQAFLLLHIKKVSQARILPPRALALGTLASLVLLALLLPTVSQDRADVSLVAGTLQLDWFYMFFYPLMGEWSMAAVWALLGMTILFLLVLPWTGRPGSKSVAVVNLDCCSGCGLCADDCPYEAISMRDRSDGHPEFKQEARVITDNCVGCGICTGACPLSNPFRRTQALISGNKIPQLRSTFKRPTLKSGIEIPEWNVNKLRQQLDQALARMSHHRPSTADGDETCELADLGGEDKILLLRCEHGAELQMQVADVESLSVPCIGMLPPAFIDYALRNGAAGVLLVGCRRGDCYHRLGDEWLRGRLITERKPFLRPSVDRSRIGLCWVAPPDRQQLRQALATLRRTLRESPGKQGDTA